MLHRETGEMTALNKMPSAAAFYIWKKKVYRHIVAEIGAFFNQTFSLQKEEYYIVNLPTV